ncbi:hypothetical protein JBE04_08855 [Streptomyces sp. PRKS01-29]|nr:hypothetical protein [Streptomyces sabulosicollis]MBI0294588.1 hypothetical protein [Streptomyces sabulosicollis]
MSTATRVPSTSGSATSTTSLKQATELVERFDRATAAFTDDQGEIRPEHRAEYQRAVSNHRFEGWGLVRTLSTLDGR